MIGDYGEEEEEEEEEDQVEDGRGLVSDGMRARV